MALRRVVGDLHSEHVGIILACCLTCGIPAAMILSTAGLFYPIIASDLNVPTAKISAWMSVSMLSSAFLSPIVGNLLSRYNIRNFMILGVLLCGVAFFVFSVGTEPWMFWLAGGITGCTLVTSLALLPSILINRWFGKHVGLLLGICTSFTGIGGVAFLALGQGIIDAFGWRAAYLAFAIIAVVVCIPVIALFVHDWPSERGLKPYGVEADALQGESTGANGAASDVSAAPRHAAVGSAGRRPRRVRTAGVRGPVAAAASRKRTGPPLHAAPAVSGRAAFRERLRRGVRVPACMRTVPFWLLVASGFFMNLVCQVNGFFPLYVDWLDNQVAYGAVAGSFTTGAVLLGLSQVGNAGGKVALGAAIDLSPAKALTLLAACGGGGTLCVWLFPSTPLMVAGGLLFGVFIAGGIVLLPMLVRTVFGSSGDFPLVLSYVMVAPTFGSALGNILFPLLAEGSGGFDAMFAVALASVAIVLSSSIAAISHAHRARV